MKRLEKISLPHTCQTGLQTTTVLTNLSMKYWKRRVTSMGKTGEGQGIPPGLILSPCSHPRNFAPRPTYPIPPIPCLISSTVGVNSPRVYRIIKSVKTSFSQIAYLILFSAARSHSSLASEVSSSSLEITISIS